MPRLLILCEYPTLLGGERSMLATLPAVAAAGFDVVVASPPNGPLAEHLAAHGIAQMEWRTHGEDGRRLPLTQLRADLARVFCLAEPHLVHANSLSTARISGPVATDGNLRSVGHLRDILRLAAQAVDDLNAHSRLLAVSNATRDFHIAQGLIAAKCHVLHNGVDLVEFAPRPSSGYLHRELNVPSETRFGAIIGQLGLRKGTDVALQAAAHVAAEHPDVHWLIIGERTSNKDESHEFERALHRLANQPHLAGRVHFLGARADVPTLLVECDLLVHAARQEPLGRVLLESAASGLPIVATDVGGTSEIFPADSNSAVLVQPDDPHALATAISGLLQDDLRRIALGVAARRRAESAFDIRNAAANLIAQYQAVLS